MRVIHSEFGLLMPMGIAWTESDTRGLVNMQCMTEAMKGMLL
ncbi:hypothetical protein [Desulfoplanes formicivorans]|uniref:Uncharacterized protein n=1 Tax=Desulfoplanes formicivorans TaxID=1592317 RepID=A0A194AGK3_9BACT|nr:hypothetical protein [Desulfoplanes formicivorans]GAU08340.1 hypothetical protein DPF_1046 [Desulfoplanes formicivorans]